MTQPLYRPTTFVWLGAGTAPSPTGIITYQFANKTVSTDRNIQFQFENTFFADFVVQVVVETAASDAKGDTAIGNVTLGSLSITVSPTDAVGETAIDTIVAGSLSVTTTSASAIGDTNIGSVVFGSLSIATTPTSAIGDTNFGTLLIDLPISVTASDAHGETNLGSVVLGSLSVSVTAASAIGETDIGTVSFSVAPVTHWFFDTRAQSWFKDTFASTDYNPLTVLLFDGDDPTDRVILLGSEDGYIRKFDATAHTDDNTAITAYFVSPPITDNGVHPLVLTELQAHTDPNGSDVLYEILTGDIPEAALNTANATFTGDGSFAAGLGLTQNPRVGGYWIYLKLGSSAATDQWSLEHVRARASKISSSRGRRRLTT